MGWLFQVVLTSGTSRFHVIIHGCRPRWRCPCLLTGLEQAARVHGEIPKSSLAPPGCQDQVRPETVLYQGVGTGGLNTPQDPSPRVCQDTRSRKRGPNRVPTTLGGPNFPITSITYGFTPQCLCSLFLA